MASDAGQTDRAAVRHLRRTDERLRDVIDHVGPYRLKITSDPFTALLSSIIHQQVSLKAAATVRSRVRDLCPRKRFSPRNIATIADADLRRAGLSGRKVRYIRDLTAHFLDRRLRPSALRAMNDEEVIAATTQVVGIGRWTAEMLLIFCLRRPDVWPVDDLGLQAAAQKFLRKRTPLAMTRLRALAEPWRPYRSCATWYMWRSLDAPVAPGLT